MPEETASRYGVRLRDKNYANRICLGLMTSSLGRTNRSTVQDCTCNRKTGTEIFSEYLQPTGRGSYWQATPTGTVGQDSRADAHNI